VFPLLEANEVNLSTIAQVSRILNQGNSSAVLARIRGKSQREVEAIVAEYEPRASLPPDRVRTVVVAVSAARACDSVVATTARLSGTHTNEYDRSGGQELKARGFVVLGQEAQR
jgi:hypothetical protein